MKTFPHTKRLLHLDDQRLQEINYQQSEALTKILLAVLYISATFGLLAILIGLSFKM